MSPNHKNRKNSDVQVRVCMTKGIGAVKARVKLVFHSSYCPVAQEGLFSFSMFVQHEVSLFVEVLCVFLQCCVLHLLYIHQDVLLQTSASHACVCIGEQLGHLLSSCLLHAICALQGLVLPCPADSWMQLHTKGKITCAPFGWRESRVRNVWQFSCLGQCLPWPVLG